MWRTLQYYKEYLYFSYPIRYRRMENTLLRRSIMLLILPTYSLRLARLFWPNYLTLKYLDLPITTRCTLRCKKCSNLMQYYETPTNVDTESLLESVKTLFRYVDDVVQLNILGGEPFLNADLPIIMEALIDNNKIQHIVVFTNGTILPKDTELTEVLKHKKIEVHISDYGRFSKKKSELCAMLLREGISFYVGKQSWRDPGGLDKRGRTEEELKEQVANCSPRCKSYFKGQLHVCPRSAHGMDLGVIPVSKDDYLDLLDETIGTVAMKRAIRRLDQHVEYITACDFCDTGTVHAKEIAPAEQM